MMARLGVLWEQSDRTRALAGAGLEVLLAEPRTDTSKVAAIGYCFGGALALELARGGADLKAVVGFHPRLSTVRPHDASNITGKVLACVGSEDPLIGVEERPAFEEEMRAGGVDWRMHLYGAQHSFTHPWAGPRESPGAQVPPALRRAIVASDARSVRRGVRLSRSAWVTLWVHKQACAQTGPSPNALMKAPIGSLPVHSCALQVPTEASLLSSLLGLIDNLISGRRPLSPTAGSGSQR